MISETRRTDPDQLGWKCSSCAEVITCIEDGWVVWLTTETERGNPVHGLRLVHKETKQGNSGAHSCRYDPRAEFRKDQTLVEGLPLERFMGSDGLMLLLSFLAVGELPKDDVLELTKRLQVPGYELTRELFASLGNEMFTPSVMRGYYLQAEIRALLRWARRDSSSAA
jgi:hypothetical protein